MTNGEVLIFLRLTMNPGTVYVTPDGKMCYALIDGGMLRFTGEFTLMDEADINLHIQNILSE